MAGENEIKNICILGMGAIGSIYAAKLHDANPGSLKIIANPDRKAAYQRSGVNVNGKSYEFNYVSPGGNYEKADLIIIAVKYPSLEKGIEDIREFVGEKTIVISLLNGISSENLIAEQIGAQHLLYAYTTITGMSGIQPNSYTQLTDTGKIVFGEKTNEQLSARVLAVKSLFEQAGIQYHIPSDMIRAQWSKFMMNTGINQASTILKAVYSKFQQPGEARSLMLMAAAEVVKIAQKCGVNLDESELDEFILRVNDLDPTYKTSMLQDIEAGRKTEIEMFSGVVISLGKKHNVLTPVNETMYYIIRSMEQTSQVKKDIAQEELVQN